MLHLNNETTESLNEEISVALAANPNGNPDEAYRANQHCDLDTWRDLWRRQVAAAKQKVDEQ